MIDEYQVNLMWQRNTVTSNGHLGLLNGDVTINWHSMFICCESKSTPWLTRQYTRTAASRGRVYTYLYFRDYRNRDLLLYQPVNRSSTHKLLILQVEDKQKKVSNFSIIFNPNFHWLLQSIFIVESTYLLIFKNVLISY